MPTTDEVKDSNCKQAQKWIPNLPAQLKFYFGPSSKVNCRFTSTSISHPHVKAPSAEMTSPNPNTVPLVDFGNFLHGSPSDRSRIAHEIDEAFRNVGFVYLRNHGIPQSRVDECFNWVRVRVHLPQLRTPSPPPETYSVLLERKVLRITRRDETPCATPTGRFTS